MECYHNILQMEPITHLRGKVTRIQNKRKIYDNRECELPSAR